MLFRQLSFRNRLRPQGEISGLRMTGLMFDLVRLKPEHLLL